MEVIETPLINTWDEKEDELPEGEEASPKPGGGKKSKAKSKPKQPKKA